MNTITIKEYDTLRISGEYQSNDGSPLSLEGLNIQATMRSMNNQYSHILGIEMSDIAQGRFVLTSPEQHFVPTLYKVDVSFLETATGIRVTNHETFNVKVLHSVTVPSGVVL
ncbi:hypothetical protein Psyc_1012 [Psychrobacter arcticus 273-4]|uniref:Uncharacterized protein n=1 Tax=Psychrobacter arcticus (strain DSM 17307 / VKM B-2377 / 273-4) TaxID=259536 RepID=Q4FSZ3_PSYA2|nr:hypothetical protein [Psychrobacter arcticus]AAZ18865.1 hypothetical protein Psyc_1012 [Psychrobacter arcticus 273-4]